MRDSFTADQLYADPYAGDHLHGAPCIAGQPEGDWPAYSSQVAPTVMGVAGNGSDQRSQHGQYAQPNEQRRSIKFKKKTKEFPRYTDVVVEKRLSVLLVQSANFVMGMAWKAALLAIVNHGKVSQDTTDVTVSELWLSTGIASSVFLAVIIILLCRKKELSHLIEETQKALGELADSEMQMEDQLWLEAKNVMYRSRIKSINSLISWGLVFSIVLQIDTAIQASFPKGSAYLKAVYFCVLFFVSLFIPTIFYWCLGERGQFLDKNAQVSPKNVIPIGLADSLLSGSGYAIGLAFLSMTASLFGLDDINKSPSILYLAIFTSVMVIISCVVLQVMDATDLVEISMNVAFPEGIPSETKTTAVPLSKEDSPLVTVVPVREVPCCPELALLCTRFGEVFRRYVAKLFVLCTTLAMWNLLYISLAYAATDYKRSVREPLPIWAAVIMVVMSAIMAVMASIFCDLMLNMTMKWILAIDEALPGSPVAALAFTVSEIILEGMLWLVGCSVDALIRAILNKVLENASTTVKISTLLVYAVLSTLCATYISVKFVPPSANETHKKVKPKDTE